MASMLCPRCPDARLDERDRDGVVIDACPSCRGIWLDRGELEKLVARSRSDSDDDRNRPRSSDGPPSSDDARRTRKKSWFDIFD